ncbi:unnamed protein product [Sphagnum troendelagicum]|uniref:RING-type domain-containing protein n=1 Tax=Sphagnum troendelagicum TaxID=128251 RepID=A0ABP0U7G5_9BRYO
MDSKAAASTPATDVDVGKEENQPESSQSVKRAEMVRTTQSSIGGVSTRESSDEEVPATETSIAPAKRTPFTSLTQVDADMALARALQEQERAYLLLRIMSEGNEFTRTGRGSGQYDFGGDDLEAPADKDEDEDEDEEEGEAAEEEEEEEEEANEEEGEVLERGVSTEGDIDGSLFDSDEAFARALQEKEDRDTTARLMALAGIHDLEVEDESDSNDSEENMWQDVDPDNMSYEELIALGEAVGTESKGLSVQAISALPGSSYVPVQQDGSNDQEQCVVCRHEYEAGDSMLTLPCKHQYHSECIQQWLQINKVCPVCSAEVTFSPTTC